MCIRDRPHTDLSDRLNAYGDAESTVSISVLTVMLLPTALPVGSDPIWYVNTLPDAEVTVKDPLYVDASNSEDGPVDPVTPLILMLTPTENP